MIKLILTVSQAIQTVLAAMQEASTALKSDTALNAKIATAHEAVAAVANHNPTDNSTAQ